MRIDLETGDLEPLVALVARRVVAELRENEVKLNGRLGYTESEAAAQLGVARHVLRDARLRGELHGRKVGKRIVYQTSELVRFLAEKD